MLWQVAVENMISDGASLFVEAGGQDSLRIWAENQSWIRFVRFGALKILMTCLILKEAWLE